MSTALKLRPAPAPFSTLPPHDQDAERALVGSIYLAANQRPDLLAEIFTKADESDFLLPENGMIVTVIRDMSRAGTAVDEITLPAELKRRGVFEDVGGLQYLAECMHSMPSAVSGPHYAKIVHEHSQLRRLIQGLGDLTARAYEPAYEQEQLSLALVQSVRELIDSLTLRETEESVTFATAIEQTMAKLEGGGVSSMATGFRDIDAAFGGFGYGETIVVAARPSMGKSLFTRQIAVQAAMRGDAVGIVAAEESRQKIVQNSLSWIASVDNNRLRLGREGGRFRDEEWKRIKNCAEEMKELPIHVADKVWDLDRICALGTAWKARHDIRMMIVDHLGLIRAQGKSPYERSSLVSVTLKQLYKQLNVAGVSVAQLNRGNTDREDKRPQLADLRDSGRIEEDADGVIMLHREDYYHRHEPEYQPTSLAEVIIAKWRDGDTAQQIKLRSRLSTQHFEDVYTHETEVLPYGL